MNTFTNSQYINLKISNFIKNPHFFSCQTIRPPHLTQDTLRTQGKQKKIIRIFFYYMNFTRTCTQTSNQDMPNIYFKISVDFLSGRGIYPFQYNQTLKQNIEKGYFIHKDDD